jgi:hypothetical protein
MFDIFLVYKLIKKILKTDQSYSRSAYNITDGKDGAISLMIHDIFGGEILKTRIKKRWHFYNRINGKRVEFARIDPTKESKVYSYEDIPSSPEEMSLIVESEEYSTLLMRFIRLFEEAYNLESYQPELSS